MLGAIAQRLFSTTSREALPASWASTFRRTAMPRSSSSTWLTSAVTRFCEPLPPVIAVDIALVMLAFFDTRLTEPVGEPRPLSVPAGPLSTSICSRLKTSREIEPMSRTPSTKMELDVSKPRMKIASPVVVLPFSPRKNAPTPGVLRSASVSVRAPCCSNSSFLMTWSVCAVSTRRSVYLGDDACSARNAFSYLPTISTLVSGTTSTGAAASMPAACAPSGSRTAASAVRMTWLRVDECLRLVIAFMARRSLWCE